MMKYFLWIPAALLFLFLFIGATSYKVLAVLLNTNDTVNYAIADLLERIFEKLNNHHI